MPAVIGILLDLSKSMKETVYEKLDTNDRSRSRSIFKVIDELLIKENVLPENKIFALGFGAQCGFHTIDIIGSIQKFYEKYANSFLTYSAKAEKLYVKLETAGAHSIRTLLPEETLEENIPFYLLSIILDALETDEKLSKKLVARLPDIFTATSVNGLVLRIVHYYLNSKKGDIESVMSDIQKYFLEDENLKKRFLTENVSEFDFDTAAYVVRYWFEGNEIDDIKIKKVLQGIEPYIYGEKIMCRAFDKCIYIFNKSEYSDFKKCLFVLSDGAPSDVDKIRPLISGLKDANVKIISCYVGNSSNVEPKRLYNEKGKDWTPGAQFMFELSSTIQTQILPYVIFENAGWSIEKNTNETKLFLQVNHPDHIHEACNVAKKIVSSQDALLSFLGSISLSRYINQVNKSATANTQVKETCYANAVAAVIHLATKRILNREGGYPDFFELRDEIIEAFGESGAVIPSVLETFSKQFRLQYKKINAEEAMEAITSNRPIIATFCLTEREWRLFSKFFSKHPKGILTKNVIDITKRYFYESDTYGGHAVVLTSFNSEFFLFMNSWGEGWGDLGFFRVQNESVFNFEFYDVFWTNDDLQNSEKDSFNQHGITFATKLVNRLKDLRSATFTCPRCSTKSQVSKFSGTFEKAVCPANKCEFDCSSEGNSLAMNLYLTTLI